MTYTPPPTIEVLAQQNGIANVSWLQFFDQMYRGDTGEDWAPTFQSLGVSGTPLFSGRYYRLGGLNLTLFRASINPNGGNTTSTGGTTYIDNYPLSFADDSVCFAVSGNVGATPGHIVSSTNRIYVPAWSSVSVPLTIIGFGEVLR